MLAVRDDKGWGARRSLCSREREFAAGDHHPSIKRNGRIAGEHQRLRGAGLSASACNELAKMDSNVITGAPRGCYPLSCRTVDGTAGSMALPSTDAKGTGVLKPHFRGWAAEESHGHGSTWYPTGTCMLKWPRLDLKKGIKLSIRGFIIRRQRKGERFHRTLKDRTSIG